MMRPFFFAMALPAVLVTNVEGRNPDHCQESPLYLTANDLSIATGKPSLVLMSSGSTHLPVWSLSGGTTGQSVAGIVNGLPGECVAVRI